jgi:hypothetical protein
MSGQSASKRPRFVQTEKGECISQSRQVSERLSVKR